MEFEFSRMKEIASALSVIGDRKEIIVFHVNDKDYELNAIISFVYMRCIREKMSNDPDSLRQPVKDAKYEFKIIATSDEEPLYENIFNSMKNGNFVFDEKDAAKYLKIARKLGINEIVDKIEIIKLQHIMKLISKDDETEKVDKMYKTISENISMISADEIAELPKFMLSKLLQNKQNFPTEDDFAKLLMKIGADAELFMKLEFSDLSERIKFEVLERVKENQAVFYEFLKEMKNTKKKAIIRVLYVYPKVNKTPYPAIVFNFDQLNEANEHYEIKLTSLKEDVFYSIIEKQKEYLTLFDVAMFGGTDSSYGQFLYTLRTDSWFFKNKECLFKAFINQGGKILSLHDNIAFFGSVFGKYKNRFAEENKVRDKIKVIDGSLDLFEYPLKINKNDDDTIDICTTHQTFVFENQMNQMIPFTDGTLLKYYYQENLKEGVAICEAGHSCIKDTQSLKQEESKLLYNIICRMYDYHSN